MKTINIILRCFLLFFLSTCVTFCLAVVDRWFETEAYDTKLCSLPSNFDLKKDIYYIGTADVYYVNGTQFNPIRLYYPPMYNIFSMSSKKDVTDWFDNIHSLTYFQCFVDVDKKLGITERYQYVIFWVILFLISVISVIYLMIDTVKRIRKSQSQSTTLTYFVNTETVPPPYMTEDVELPGYERALYDVTPPSDVISINDNDQQIQNRQ